MTFEAPKEPLVFDPDASPEIVKADSSDTVYVYGPGVEGVSVGDTSCPSWPDEL